MLKQSLRKMVVIGHNWITAKLAEVVDIEGPAEARISTIVQDLFQVIPNFPMMI